MAISDCGIQNKRGRKGLLIPFLMILLTLSFFFWNLLASFSSQMDPAMQWHLLYIKIRDGSLPKEEARSQLRTLETSLKESYLKNSDRKEEGPLCFPIEGYGASAIGGKGGSGYQAHGFDFFDGNQHKGHPGHDIFIRDRDQDGIDDLTGRAVNVLSVSSGIVVSVDLDWTPPSPVRGGNYIWIYEPIGSRYYYYAHLGNIFVEIGQIVSRGERIGIVGRTGKNAYPGRSPTHLHFAVHHSEEGYPKPVNSYKELVNGSCE